MHETNCQITVCFLSVDAACGKVGFCDDPPSLKLWRTEVPDQARPTGRARQQATRRAGFCRAFFKKALIELRQRSSETTGNPPSGTTMRHRSKDFSQKLGQ